MYNYEFEFGKNLLFPLYCLNSQGVLDSQKTLCQKGFFVENRQSSNYLNI